MAKKRSNRKHNFKHTAPTRAETTVKPADGPKLTEAAPPKAAAKSRVGDAALQAEFGLGMTLVKRDLRRVSLLAVSFVALQLVLWYLFNHTGLGASVYNLVKL